MFDDKQTETIATGMGLVALGAGSGFALLPGFSARGFGINKTASEEAGSQVVVRVLGFRDITFGVGLLLARNEPKQTRLWLRLLSLSFAGDTIACLLALRKPNVSPTIGLGGLLSLALSVVAWLAGQEKK